MFKGQPVQKEEWSWRVRTLGCFGTVDVCQGALRIRGLGSQPLRPRPRAEDRAAEPRAPRGRPPTPLVSDTPFLSNDFLCFHSFLVWIGIADTPWEAAHASPFSSRRGVNERGTQTCFFADYGQKNVSASPCVYKKQFCFPIRQPCLLNT